MIIHFVGKYFNKRSIRGFSLLELALVLAIAGISIGSGMVVFNEYAKVSRITQTKAKLEELLDAIDDYGDKFNRLPCPADGTDKFGDVGFGIGTHDGSECTTENEETGSIVMGMIPVSTLNLYPTYAFDGWGNRISYVINEESGAVNGLDDTDAEITLENYDGTSTYSEVVVALISHGANGFGAYPGRGGSRIGVDSGNDVEDMNNGTDDAFRSSVSVAEFDDIVYFWTREQITDPEME